MEMVGLIFVLMIKTLRGLDVGDFWDNLRFGLWVTRVDLLYHFSFSKSYYYSLNCSRSMIKSKNVFSKIYTRWLV